MISADAFQITYVTPGSGVEGDYFGDNLKIGSVTLKNITMAVASSAAAVPMGILGIDFDARESWATAGNEPYDSVIDEMLIQGVINRRAYSLWLDDLGKLVLTSSCINAHTYTAASSGTILFGGLDESKWTGNFTVLPIQIDE